MRQRRVALFLLLILGGGGSSMAIERPKFTAEFVEKPFEVRNYAPTIVATVHVDGDRSEAVNAGFRILAGYIFGDNQARTKIAMTAPVTQNTGTSIPMTAPVNQRSASRGWDISFTMPATYTLEMLPTPQDKRIRLVRVPESRMACITFSGFWSDANFQSHRDQLLDFLKERRLNAGSAPIYAYYNPPWTPWFMRTNEILIDITAAKP